MEYQPLTLEALAHELEKLPHWEMRDGWLRRRFHTPGWSHTMMLVQVFGYLAEAAYHHPDLEVAYASVVVKLQTHKVKAITHHDIELAKKYDEVALWQPAEGAALDGYPKKWVH